jgi:hypothetical protein
MGNIPKCSPPKGWQVPRSALPYIYPRRQKNLGRLRRHAALLHHLQSTNHLHVHSLHVLPATSYYTACPSRRACVDSETLTFHYIPIDARCRGSPTQVGQKDEGIAQLEITAALSQHTPHVFCMRGQRTGLPRRHQYHLQSMIGIREHREMDAMELLDALATTHERNGLGQVPCFARSTRCVATALLA